jgi:two-component system, NarL family, nitrate/nitrite response regulator NarL
VAATVLIVDDHPVCRRAAAELLTEDGYEVVGAEASGQDALAAADRLHPGIVVLDVGLPDMDGLEVARRLTARRNGTVPAVVLASSRDPSDLGDVAERCGARGAIAKDALSGNAIAALAAA